MKWLASFLLLAVVFAGASVTSAAASDADSQIP